MQSMAGEAVILIKDLQGEKSGKIGGLLKPSPKPVCRGELLLSHPRDKIVPRKDGKPAHNYHVARDPGVTVYGSEEHVAPLSPYEYHLLAAVKTTGGRYGVFQNDRLDWGSKLTLGTFVHAALPSKSPVPNQPVVSKIHYIGALPHENGCFFGVEIMDPNYRKHGSSNGWFGGKQYFECEENAGMFVSLDRLSPMDPEPAQQGIQPMATNPSDGRQQKMVTRSQDSHGGRPSQQDNRQQKPRQSQFKLCDRVVVYDKKGQGIHGSVQWIMDVRVDRQSLPVVGIETDVSVQSREFAGALTGLGQHFKCRDSRHGRLAMPESMVVLEREDAAKREQLKQIESSVDPKEEKALENVVDRNEQIRALQEYEKANKERQRSSGSRLDDGHYEPIPRELTDQPPPYPKQPTSHPRSAVRQVSATTTPSTATTSAQARKHAYDSPDRSRKDLLKMREHHSVQDEYLSGHQHGHLGAPAPLQHQRSMPASSVDDHALVHQPPHQPDDPHYCNIPMLKDGQHQESAHVQPHVASQDYMNFPAQHELQNPAQQSQYTGNQPIIGGAYQNPPQQGSAYQPDHYQDPSRARDPRYQQNQDYRDYQDNRGYRDNRHYLGDQGYQHDQGYAGDQGYLQDQHGAGGPIPANRALQSPPGSAVPQHKYPSAQSLYPQPSVQKYQRPAGPQGTSPPHQQHGYGDGQHGGEYGDVALPQGRSTMVVAARPTISHSFSMGSTVQLTSDPARCGVIQWIGNLPDIHGQIAGVELEEPMEGCADGTWKGVRYFNCRQGQGFFCPLSSLVPDQRFAQTTTGGGINPLDYVAFDEEEDQFVDPGQIDKYIGEAKGIQGHQNSCYLDSIVFGLFALSDVFDSMFLDQKAGDPAGDEVKHLLWKGIINPLRKNAVVRHESVMRLRNKLEELGKMKGVNQDEKDPEEFLNVLFKHTLHVTPFIRIKRPFGVEQEYFVQLFVEHDKSLQLPTVGDLLGRMFIEQKIRFTKVPSKLLIQIPQYGREFRTYQKTIPGLKLEVKRLVCSKHKCLVCGDAAWNECRECSSDFSTDDVIYFCENCSKRAHGEATNRTKHKVTEVTPDPGGINELDLLSVICIETSHYICFTRSEERWMFFDSMASRVDDMYNIPKVVDCTDVLNEWVYPANGDLTRLLNTPPRELPEYVRRFTQDIYLCVYIQPDFAMYGDVDEDDVLNDAIITDETGGSFESVAQAKESHMKYVEKQQLSEAKMENTSLVKAQQNLEKQLKKEIDISRQIQLRLSDAKAQNSSLLTTHQELQEDLRQEKESSAQLKQQLTEARTENASLLSAQQESIAFGIEPWKVPRNSVQLVGQSIGGGGWGTVYKGNLQVAVKQFHPNILSERNLSRLKREMRMLALVRHPNILQFIAAVFDDNGDHRRNPPYIITELLDSSLRSAYETQALPSGSLLSIFQDTARALDYLHRRHEPIIHRDVSSANVLLKRLPNDKWVAKLSDLGSANLAKEAYTMNEGARVYCAPEAFTFDTNARSAGTLTPQVDVYSYGIVLCEVATRTFPDRDKFQEMLNRVRREWPQLYQVVINCTNSSPEKRPSMASVLSQLEALPQPQR